MQASANPSDDPLRVLAESLGEDDSFDPATAALAVAAAHYPTLDIPRYLWQPDLLAAQARERIGRARAN